MFMNISYKQHDTFRFKVTRFIWVYFENSIQVKQQIFEALNYIEICEKWKWKLLHKVFVNWFKMCDA